MRIYTIGVGSDGRNIRTPFGAFALGASELDEKTLAAVADTTGGAYFRARDTTGLVRIYQQIDALEPSEGDAATVRPLRALFHWPLAGALLAALVLTLPRALRAIGPKPVIQTGRMVGS